MSRNKPQYQRGEIWWVALDPAVGDEARKRCDPDDVSSSKERAPRGTRPCLILQNDTGNQYSSITIIAPFLEPKNYPFVVNVKKSESNGLDRERGLNLSQLRVVHYSRFSKRLGTIESSYWEKIEQAIAIELAIFDY